ncbi:MAG TPA: hypothetical protein VF988_17650, partial [Verrucomicrobiae bacterium]
MNTMLQLNKIHQRKLAVAASLLAAAGLSANAQSVQTYFNLQSYGSVSAGSTIVDSTGNTHATLNNDGITSLTSGGLSSTGGGNSGNNGLVFAAGSLSGFTGSFTIQDWVTVNGATGSVLFGGNTANGGNTWCGDGSSGGVSTMLGFTWGSLTSGGYGGNHTGTAYNRWGQHVGNYSLGSGLQDLVLTYDASTYTFSQYINGTLTATAAIDF